MKPTDLIITLDELKRGVEPIGKIINADCLEVMRYLNKDNLVLITDPPYGINLDLSWLSSLHIKRGKPPNKSDDKIVGDNNKVDFPFLFQFSKRLIWGHPYIYDKKAIGWLVWDKQPGVERRGLCTPIEIASTTLWKGFDRIWCMWGGYLKPQGEYRYNHPTQKPVKIFFIPIKERIKDKDIVLDPFLGSGTTAIACERLGRKWIGIEIEPKFCEIAAERIWQERRQKKLNFG